MIIPPDLTEFCKPFGGLGNMTPERWQEWEALNKRYAHDLEREREDEKGKQE